LRPGRGQFLPFHTSCLTRFDTRSLMLPIANTRPAFTSEPYAITRSERHSCNHWFAGFESGSCSAGGSELWTRSEQFRVLHVLAARRIERRWASALHGCYVCRV